MRGIVTGGNNGGGSGGLCKIFTGTATPASPREYDIWVKEAITINKYVFDKDFSTSKVYSDKSLIFYITSNPTDQGYKIMTQLFNRSVKIDMQVPLYLAGFYSGGAWTYPLVYVYVGGVWTYLSGAQVDANSKVSVFNTTEVTTSSYTLKLNSYTLEGAAHLTDKVVATALPRDGVLAAATSPVDGSRYVVVKKTSYTTPKYFITVDKDGNFVDMLEVSMGSSHSASTGDSTKILVDGNYAYIIDRYGGYGPQITKIDTATKTVVATASIGSSSNSSMRNAIAQTSTHIFISSYKISKADLSYTGFNTLGSGSSYTFDFIDTKGRLIMVYGVTTTTVKVSIINSDTLALIKAVTLTLPYTLSNDTSGLQGCVLDKNDNLTLWGAQASTYQNYLTKFTKDATNDTWVQFMHVTAQSTSTSTASNNEMKCDPADAIYGNFSNHNGMQLQKINSNLTIVFTKVFTGSENAIAVDPCDISTDYNRQYYK